MLSTASSEMGETYVVTAVRYGTLATDRSDVFLNYRDYRVDDAPADMDYYFWVIRNDARTVVLDTGFAVDVGTRRGRVVCVDPREALDALDVRDERDTLLVISHAHYDHVGNLDHLPNARMLVAAREYDFWVRHPRRLRLTDQLVEPAELATIRSAYAAGRLALLPDGDTEIAPGILALAGYGHTPGQLMLLVQTEIGGLLLTSDAVHVDEELSARMPFRHMCDLRLSADTYDLIDEMTASGRAARVVAGHQPGLVGRLPAHPRLPAHSAVLSSPSTTPTKEESHGTE